MISVTGQKQYNNTKQSVYSAWKLAQFIAVTSEMWAIAVLVIQMKKEVTEKHFYHITVVYDDR